MVLTDDQPGSKLFDTIDSMPIIKRDLQARGMRFVNNFIPTPLCSPCRASLLRGQLRLFFFFLGKLVTFWENV